jgi:Restriction endonuclease
MQEKRHGEASLFSDVEIASEVTRVSGAIEAWARENELWHDCGFKSWLEENDDEPGSECPLMVMWGEGPMYSVWNGRHDGAEAAFRHLLESLGYWYENQNGAIINIYANEDIQNQKLAAHARWQWLQSLVLPDFSDVSAELYEHFAKYPNDLQKLKHRDFEVLLSRIFIAQGFNVELGPGTGDGGVDVKLWYRDKIGDVLTYVQAKRYSPKNAIELEAVAALSGVVHTDGATNGLFVTTSRYLKSAQKFAAAVRSKIQLKDSSDVAEWCLDAAGRVSASRASLVSESQLSRLLFDLRGVRSSPRVLHSIGMAASNRFAVVLMESRHAALLLIVRARNVLKLDHIPLQGWEVPDLDSPPIWPLPEELIFRAKRRVNENGRVLYWGGRNLFHVWDGEPQYYDMLD